MPRLINREILFSPVNVIIVLLISSLGMIAIRGLVPANKGT